MKGTTLVAIVAIAVILVGTSVFVYIGLPINNAVETNSIVSAPQETAPLAYIIAFAYSANPIFAGQNETVGIEITQASFQVPDVSGEPLRQFSEPGILSEFWFHDRRERRSFLHFFPRQECDSRNIQRLCCNRVAW